MNIQGLKDKILQLAIQGKLVNQDPNYEPASVLLEKIKEERNRLVKEKKIRRPKKLPPIEEEEKHFEIPEGWEWVRLGEVSNNYDSKRKPISIKNRDNLRKIYDYYGATGVIDKVDDFIFDGLYLLIGEDGGNFFNNKDVAFIVEGKFWANNHVHVLDFFNETLTRHIKNTLNSIDFKDRELITGIAVPKLNQTNLNNILIPLPPLAEQKRIVEKVDQLFALIDGLDSNKEDLLEVINLTRNQVLQEAIQGKLVEQNPEDEPTSVLLEKIKEERDRLVKEKKIRKPKKLPPIEEEKLFKLPDSWEWVRFQDVLDVRDGTHDTPKYIKQGVPLVTSKNLTNGNISLDNVKYISMEDHIKISERSNVENDDILFAMIGSIGNPVIVKKDIDFSIKNVALFKYYKKGLIEPKYLYYYLLFSQENMKEQSSGGVQSFVSLTFLRNYIFPLPPLAEQKRIVEKVDTIMNMLDELENELTTKI